MNMVVEPTKNGNRAGSDEVNLVLIHEQVENQARQYPGRIAASHGGKEISFKALNLLVSQLAGFLVANGHGAQSRVGIFLDRSINSLVAMLATMKAGAVYIPLDTKQPGKRLRHIIQDGKMDCLLFDCSSSSQYVQADLSDLVKTVDLDQIDYSNYSFKEADVTIIPTDPAYCLYTSGTTGKPKGVVITHQGMCNYINWARDYYLNDDIHNFALFTSLAFDLTVTSIFVPLTAGLHIDIYDDQEGKETPLVQVLRDNKAHILKLTPSQLVLLDEFDGVNSNIKAIILGGENLKRDTALRVSSKFHHKVAIYNEYGPTETVVGCSVHRFDPKADKGASVPIGKAISNMQLYLLDDNLDPVEQGSIGQIFIAGVGVADGYFNRPELTLERFIYYPAKDTLVYVSGDLAKINAMGELLYLGRIDEQVKVNGYRIELAEVEQAFQSFDSIQDCTVSTSLWAVPVGEVDNLIYCSACGLASDFPNTVFDPDQVCNHCQAYNKYQSVIQNYFRTMSDFQRLIDEIKQDNDAEYDCIVALSGGKDSTYALCKIVETGAKVLAVTLDVGYLSDGARENIELVVGKLGLAHRFLSTPAMNEIFADSLHRHSNVCNGCFKTLYTLCVNLALELNIGHIVTGLSRGQLFETRLTNMFRNEEYNEKKIESDIIKARVIYHRMDDAVSRLLDTQCFLQDDIFERVKFVDFYRYCHVSLEEVYRYLKEVVGWQKPGDTGRSTNCLINNTGIYVHNKERGYHNYSLPYSWDVRLGHKKRQEAMQELNDFNYIDTDEVFQIMDEIGYELKSNNNLMGNQLIGYYVADKEISEDALKDHIRQQVPGYMVPDYLVRIAQLPLTTNGKVNRKALPRPEMRRTDMHVEFKAPETELEKQMAKLWCEALNIKKVGIYDNFFDIGGNSLPAALLLFNISETFSHTISIEEFHNVATISQLCAQIEKTA